MEKTQGVVPFLPELEFNAEGIKHLVRFSEYLANLWANGYPAEGLSEDGTPNSFPMDPLDYMHQATALSLVAPSTMGPAFLPEEGYEDIFIDRAAQSFRHNEEGLDLDAFLFFALHRERFSNEAIVEIRRAFWNHAMDHYSELLDREDASPIYKLNRLVVSAFLLPNEKDTIAGIRRNWDLFLGALEEAMREENLAKKRRLYLPDPLDETGRFFHAQIVHTDVIDTSGFTPRGNLTQDSSALSEAATLAEGMTILCGLVKPDQCKAFKNSSVRRELIDQLRTLVHKGMEGRNISSEAFICAAKSLTLLTADPVYIMPNGKVVLAGQTSCEDA